MREFVELRTLGPNPVRHSTFFRLSSGFTIEIDEIKRVMRTPEILKLLKTEKPY